MRMHCWNQSLTRFIALSNFEYCFEEDARGNSSCDDQPCYWDTDSKPGLYDMLTVTELKKVKAFKSTISLSPEKVRELERKTRYQNLCELWYFALRYRTTASNFGITCDSPG